MSASWTYLLADLRTNRTIAELPLTNVRMTKVLNDSGKLTASLPLSKTYSFLDVRNITTPARTVVYALRDGSPWWGGIIWTRRFKRSTGVVEFGCGDFWSYFDRRFILDYPLNLGDGVLSLIGTQIVEYDDMDQNDIVRILIGLSSVFDAGSIGIDYDTNISGINRTMAWGGYQLKRLGDDLRRITALTDGPDLMFDVSGPDSQGRPQRILRVGDPQLGTFGAPHVFEYGANLLDYDWSSDGGQMATRTYATGDGIEQGTPISTFEDASLYDDGWPLLEKETGYPSIDDPALLLSYATADQQSASLPVVTPTLTVTGDGSPQIGEFAPGDDCRVIIQDEWFGDPGLDTRMRIVGVQATPGDTVEQVAITVNPLLGDVT